MKLDYIDSMRGVAILLVVLVHTEQSISFILARNNAGEISWLAHTLAFYGQMGVQLFFVVSAFTLCLSWSRRNAEQRKVLCFFIRRLFRIAPQYYFGILLYFLVKIFENFIKTNRFMMPEQHIVSNLVTNVLFIHDFHPAGNVSIVPGGWSIATEMSFYCIFPFLFIGLSKIAAFSERWLFIAVLVLVASNFLLLTAHESLYGIRLGNNNFVYYSFSNQFPVFLLGMLWFFQQQKKQLRARPGWLCLLFFVILTLAAMLLMATQWPYSFHLVPMLSGLSFIFLLRLFAQQSWLNFRGIIKAGRLSFSMYIFHFLFAYQVAGKVSEQIVHFLNPDLLLLFAFILALALTMLASLVTERYIERPGIRVGRSLIVRLGSAS